MLRIIPAKKVEVTHSEVTTAFLEGAVVGVPMELWVGHVAILKKVLEEYLPAVRLKDVGEGLSEIPTGL